MASGNRTSKIPTAGSVEVKSDWSSCFSFALLVLEIWTTWLENVLRRTGKEAFFAGTWRAGETRRYPALAVRLNLAQSSASKTLHGKISQLAVLCGSRGSSCL
jgi:hypothetical protein